MPRKPKPVRNVDLEESIRALVTDQVGVRHSLTGLAELFGSDVGAVRAACVELGVQLGLTGGELPAFVDQSVTVTGYDAQGEAVDHIAHSRPTLPGLPGPSVLWPDYEGVPVTKVLGGTGGNLDFNRHPGMIPGLRHDATFAVVVEYQVVGHRYKPQSHDDGADTMTLVVSLYARNFWPYVPGVNEAAAALDEISHFARGSMAYCGSCDHFGTAHVERDDGTIRCYGGSSTETCTCREFVAKGVLQGDPGTGLAAAMEAAGDDMPWDNPEDDYIFGNGPKPAAVAP